MSGPILVLSGGGAKAAAHLGAWRALREAGLMPRRIVATSFGAAVGAALASGLEPAEVLERLTRLGPDGVRAHPLVTLAGVWLPDLLRPEPFRRALEALVPARAFEELTLPLTLTATDLGTMDRVAFGHGGQAAPLLDALLAACALPPWFPAVPLGGRLLADGGLRGALPLWAVGEPGDATVIAVDVGPTFALGREPRVPRRPALVQAADEALGILMAQVTEDAVEAWRAAGRPLTLVRPVTERNATFRTDRMAAYEAAGHRATRAALGLGET